MVTELFISRKLSLSSGGHKSAPAVKVAMAAVALSIAVMLASIAVVLGFKQEIREKVTGFNSHITLYSTAEDGDDTNTIAMWPALEQILDDAPFVTSYNLEVSIPAILKTPTDFKGVYMKGYGKGADVSFLGSALEEGRLPDFAMKNEERPEIIISRKAADRLQLKAGDQIDTYFISDDVRVRRMYISGIYNSRFDRYDDVLIFGPISLLQELGGIKQNQGTTIRVMTNDFDHVAMHSETLQRQLAEATLQAGLPKAVQVENVMRQGAGYFNWLELLDTNVAVILVLMTIVACVTLVSGMFIIILDKIRFIGVMKALGMRNSALRRVFIFMAMRVAFWGMLCGYGLMLTLLWVQEKTHFIPLDPESYYFDFVPVRMAWGYFVLLGVGVMALIFLILLLPSHIVAGISPAKTMRDAD